MNEYHPLPVQFSLLWAFMNSLRVKSCTKLLDEDVETGRCKGADDNINSCFV
jgi:hypothetical protein